MGVGYVERCGATQRMRWRHRLPLERRPCCCCACALSAGAAVEELVAFFFDPYGRKRWGAAFICKNGSSNRLTGVKTLKSYRIILKYIKLASRACSQSRAQHFESGLPATARGWISFPMLIFNSPQLAEPALHAPRAPELPKVALFKWAAGASPERGLRSPHGRPSTAQRPQTGPVGALDQRP